MSSHSVECSLFISICFFCRKWQALAMKWNKSTTRQHQCEAWEWWWRKWIVKGNQCKRMAAKERMTTEGVSFNREKMEAVTRAYFRNQWSTICKISGAWRRTCKQLKWGWQMIIGHESPFSHSQLILNSSYALWPTIMFHKRKIFLFLRQTRNKLISYQPRHNTTTGKV